MATNREDFLKKLKKNNAVEVVSAEEVDQQWVRKLSTGVLALDLVLKGGYPAGSVVNLTGVPGSGKGLMMNLAMAQNQKKYKADSSILWVSFGAAADIDYMRLCGVRIKLTDGQAAARKLSADKLGEELLSPTVGSIDILQLSPDAADKDLAAQTERILEAVLLSIETRAHQLIVVDEIGSGESMDSQAKSLTEEEKMANWARLFTRFLKRLATLQARKNEGSNDAIVMFGNPVRANVDSYTAKFRPYIQTSGHALAHATTVSLVLSNAGAVKEGSEKAGKTIQIKVDKAKLGTSEGAVVHVNFLFDYGPDLIDDLVSTAVSVGIVKQLGTKTCRVVIKDVAKDIPCQSIKEFIGKLYSDDPEMLKLRAALFVEMREYMVKLSAIPVGHH